MTTTHKIKLHLEAQPSLSTAEIIVGKGISPLLFEALGKALGSVGREDDGIGTAEDQTNRVVASIDKMTPDSLGESLEFSVSIEAIG